MNEQLFSEGFRVRTNECSHRTRLMIDSYVSARIMVNPSGLIAFAVVGVGTLSIYWLAQGAIVAVVLFVLEAFNAFHPQPTSARRA